jgi:hypothetical protein
MTSVEVNNKITKETPLDSIIRMGPKEFQMQLVNGTLPEFDRKFVNGLYPRPLERDTNFPFRLLTMEELDAEELNQGYLKRHHLEFMSVRSFKRKYYEEFREKPSTYEDKYYDCSKKEELTCAMDWIMNMSPDEFEDCILEDTLPKFEREPKPFSEVVTMVHANKGYLHRNELRYTDVDTFRKKYYAKTQPKMTIEETMMQIEREAEAKVIQGYKTGKIQFPKSEETDSEKQIDLLKNIMAEGAKKFEAAAGRPMSYLEMRQMYG